MNNFSPVVYKLLVGTVQCEGVSKKGGLRCSVGELIKCLHAHAHTHTAASLEVHGSQCSVPLWLIVHSHGGQLVGRDANTSRRPAAERPLLLGAQVSASSAFSPKYLKV